MMKVIMLGPFTLRSRKPSFRAHYASVISRYSIQRILQLQLYYVYLSFYFYFFRSTIDKQCHFEKQITEIKVKQQEEEQILKKKGQKSYKFVGIKLIIYTRKKSRGREKECRRQQIKTRIRIRNSICSQLNFFYFSKDKIPRPQQKINLQIHHQDRQQMIFLEKLITFRYYSSYLYSRLDWHRSGTHIIKQIFDMQLTIKQQQKQNRMRKHLPHQNQTRNHLNNIRMNYNKREPLNNNNIHILQDQKQNDILFITSGTLNLQPNQNIKNLEISYNNTLILRTKNTQILHIGSDQQVLSKLELKTQVNSLKMANQNQVIIFCDKNRLYTFTVWNLKTNKSVQMEYYHISYKIDSDWFWFKDNQTICVWQKSQDRIKLLYFKYPIKQKSIPFHTNFIKNSGQNIIKLNQQSMVGFIQPSDTIKVQKFKFKTYKICQKTGKGILDSHQINIPQNILNPRKEEYIQISDIFEIKLNEFILKILVKQLSEGWSKRKQQKQCIYFNFDSLTQKIQRCKLVKDFQKDSLSTLFQIQFLQNMRRKQEMIIHYPHWPVYYADAQTEEILTCQLIPTKARYQERQVIWPSSPLCNKLLTYQIDRNWSHNKVQYEIFKMPQQWRVQWLQRKLVQTFLMQQTVPNCDEDILYQVCGLINDEQYN